MEPQPLLELKIEVTQHCPLACIHCSSDAYPGSATAVQLEDCIRMIGEAVSLGARSLTFSGGEPLEWEGIEEAVGWAKSLGLDVTIYTSGNAANANVIMRSLRGAGADRLVFSVFGASSRPHERITRISGSFQATIDAITVAVTEGFAVELHFAALADNYRELPGVARMARGLGVGRVSVLRFVPQGRGEVLTSAVLNRVQNVELRRMIRALRAEGFEIRTGSPLNVLMVNDIPECKSGQDRLTVGPDLSVHPCDAFKGIGSAALVGTSSLSNLSTCSLATCWNRSPYLLAVRAACESPPGRPCDTCSVLEICGGGCLAQRFLNTGQLNVGTDPACMMSSANDHVEVPSDATLF
jgi:radical SAM protein with 4Fe4S-binding SPASM domain